MVEITFTYRDGHSETVTCVDVPEIIERIAESVPNRNPGQVLRTTLRILVEMDELPPKPACSVCDDTGSITYPTRITPDGKTVYGSDPCGLCQDVTPVDPWKWAS
jgi:hypothetical protein